MPVLTKDNIGYEDTVLATTIAISPIEQCQVGMPIKEIDDVQLDAFVMTILVKEKYSVEEEYELIFCDLPCRYTQKDIEEFEAEQANL